MLVKQKKVKYDLFIEVIRVKHKKGISLGFTLVELLVVIGILTVLLAIALIAINPFEQINKTTDVSTKATIKDFASATKYFYAEEKTTPWVKNSSCRDELSTQDTISQMPSCVQELTKGGDLQTQAINSNEAKDIFMTECSNSIALCYKPKSSTYKNNSQAKFQRNGAPNPKCPDDENCYICEFTTNEAQECFEIMSPNSEVAIAHPGSPSEIAPIIERPYKGLCGEPINDGRASCAAEIVTDSQGNPLSTIATPNGLSPEQLHKAYGLPCTPGGPIGWQCDTPSTFGPRIVAVVVAYHSPTLESDLAVYSSQFGLPPCTKANGCLTVVNQEGNTSPLPAGVVGEWAGEEALDVQTLHAICQTCKILVVETNTNYMYDLSLGVRRAGLMGATAINNSYAASERYGANLLQFEPYYSLPGIFVVAASGDWGYGAWYPASSNNVIGVTGTSLFLRNDNTYGSEVAWNLTGSGCSDLFDAFPFQTSLPNWQAMGCGAKRGIADVSAVGDPRTGIAIYNTTASHGRTGWYIAGGTSLSSPIIAAALAMQEASNNGTGASYIYENPTKFRDVTQGGNGGCSNASCKAGVGYDGPTGIGSPNFLPQGGITPTELPTPTMSPTPLPTFPPTPYLSPTPTRIPTPIPTPRDTVSSSDPSFGYIVDTIYRVVTKVTNLGTQLDNKCEEVEKMYCHGTFRLQSSAMTGNRCLSDRGESFPVYNLVGCSTLIVETPWPTPTPAFPNCSKQHTVTLKNNSPIIAVPDATVTNTLSIKNNNTGNCNPLKYWVSYGGYPGTWTLNGITNPYMIGTGDTKDINFTIKLPPIGLSDKDYPYRFWVSANEPTEYTYWWVKSYGPVEGAVRVTQSGNTNSPSPTPTVVSNCDTMQTVTLAQPIISAIPGATVTNTLSVKNNNTGNCSSVFYTISRGYPLGWVQNGIPNSFTLTTGETKNIEFSMVLSTSGLLVQDYIYQFWVAKQGQTVVENPANGIVRVTQASPTNPPTPSPTPTQTPTPTPTLPVQPTNPPINYDTIVPGYHIDQSKFFKTYAVYFFDHPGFAPSGAGWNMQISTRSDFTASYPDQLTSYGIPSSYGQDAPLNDSYAALRNITNKYVGFTSIIPYDYNQNHCCQTIYWRITNFYNPSATDKKYGPTYTGVIDCTTKVGMVDPPLSWYAVFDYGTYKQKYYEPLWDYDKNGVINWMDYWLGAFSTKFRSGGWQPPE